MNSMLETMHAANGIGLAAPQVGVLKRVIVVDISQPEEPAQPYRMANPEIVWHTSEIATGEEGCLSLPEHFGEVARPEGVRVRYIDENGEGRELEAHGLLAKCIQHEIDHLEGVAVRRPPLVAEAQYYSSQARQDEKACHCCRIIVAAPCVDGRRNRRCRGSR